MTILRVQPEALVALRSLPSSDTEYLLKEPFEPLLIEESDDDDSVDTMSTATFSYDSSFSPRVSFSTTLVTDVWERPPTPEEQVNELFYTKEETERYVVPSLPL